MIVHVISCRLHIKFVFPSNIYSLGRNRSICRLWFIRFKNLWFLILFLKLFQQTFPLSAHLINNNNFTIDFRAVRFICLFLAVVSFHWFILAFIFQLSKKNKLGSHSWHVRLCSSAAYTTTYLLTAKLVVVLLPLWVARTMESYLWLCLCFICLKPSLAIITLTRLQIRPKHQA